MKYAKTVAAIRTAYEKYIGRQFPREWNGKRPAGQ
jgi:hypothetical protein